MNLAIISHTEHYETATGEIVGWGPTITEINHLLDVFDTIYHVAMLYEESPPPSALPYISDRIKFVPLKPSGGKTLFSKFQTLLRAPFVVNIVAKTLKEVDYFQLRTPTGIAVYLIPFLSYFSNKKGWYKYAGNWRQRNAPFGYRLQRWMLLNQSRIVTINGFWDKQATHCYTFENPCLTEKDIIEGSIVRAQKNFQVPLQFCFVGRLERPKGVERIITAFKSLSDQEKQLIGCVHMVGDGTDYLYFQDLAKTSAVSFHFHGFLPRDKVFNIYKQCHVFLMPTTASEGFPKVIAEAMNYGCLPIVSNISSIGHYLKHGENALLLDKTITANSLIGQIRTILELSNLDYLKLINGQDELLEKFTFSHYGGRVANEILNNS